MAGVEVDIRLDAESAPGSAMRVTLAGDSALVTISGTFSEKRNIKAGESIQLTESVSLADLAAAVDVLRRARAMKRR
jgi:hypothetical protein